MKKITISTLLAMAVLFLLSCEEEAKPAHVQGKIEVSTGGSFEFDGDLAKKGTELYGYCESDGDTFKFELGHDDSEHVQGSDEIYIYANGIKGPVKEGVFDTDGKTPKDDPKYYSTFSSIRIKNTNKFSIVGSDYESQCHVELWATPADGELTPETNYSSGKRKFEHYIRINCSGIDVEAGDAILRSFSAELYFSNC